MTATAIQATPRSTKRTWPRIRLLLRSAISSIMPIRWTWAAVTALIPYFWAEHGPGTSGLTLLGLTRSTWMSLHVWSSIAMVLLTIAHTVLNRKGVSKSYKVMAGARTNSASQVKGRPWAWLAGAAAMALLVTVGGFWFASIDAHETSGGGGADHATAADIAGADHVEGSTGGGWGRNRTGGD